MDFDSDAYNQRRREAIEKFVGGGVEVAPTYYRNRDIDTSTISESYYRGSRDSMELRDYYSSSQAPDTNSCYESSDYRVSSDTIKGNAAVCVRDKFRNVTKNRRCSTWV